MAERPGIRGFVAPFDLRAGHILEFRLGQSVTTGWVAAVEPTRFIPVVVADRFRAYEEASNRPM